MIYNKNFHLFPGWFHFKPRSFNEALHPLSICCSRSLFGLADNPGVVEPEREVVDIGEPGTIHERGRPIEEENLKEESP